MDKNFYNYLYKFDNVPDIIGSYCETLLMDSNPLTRFKAKRLLNYWSLLNDTAFFNKRIQSVFGNLHQEIDCNFPSLTYELSGRIKSLTSTLNKMDEIEAVTINKLEQEFIVPEYKKIYSSSKEDKKKLIKEIENQLHAEEDNETKERFALFVQNYNFEKNPFSRIRDFFAFRIIIEDEGKGDMIDELYQVTNLMIEFFIKSTTFEVVPSHPLVQTGLNVKSEIIHVPLKSGLKEEYIELVKDYVLCPKQDGYQSLHFVVFDPFTERFFEVQVRTRSMDIIAETLANHLNYKLKKYGNRPQQIKDEVDFSQIHVKGFRYFKYNDPETGEEKVYISDKAGITEAIPIKLELEHFLATIV